MCSPAFLNPEKKKLGYAVPTPFLSIPNPQLRIEHEFIKYLKNSLVMHHLWVVSSYLSETL